MIMTAKKSHWEEFLQTVNNKSIWTTHHYASGDPTDGSKTRVPMLKLGRHEDGMTNEAVSNEEKDEAFAKTFFSTPEVETPPSDDYEYPTPKFTFSPITNLQITRVIAQISPHKAPNPAGIPNSVYMQCTDLLVLHLGPVYQATFKIGVYPKQWQDLTTVVVRKLGKPDYMKLGAY